MILKFIWLWTSTCKSDVPQSTFWYRLRIYLLDRSSERISISITEAENSWPNSWGPWGFGKSNYSKLWPCTTTKGHHSHTATKWNKIKIYAQLLAYLPPDSIFGSRNSTNSQSFETKPSVSLLDPSCPTAIIASTKLIYSLNFVLLPLCYEKFLPPTPHILTQVQPRFVSSNTP